MKTFLHFLIILLSLNMLSAQIKITEVNFDVPGSEKLYYYQDSHLGEFIELYNYTDQPIDLSGWLLKDIAQTFTFPAGTIIGSADYLVVAYQGSPIPSYYPSSVGHEAKIIYQNQLVLRNNREHIQLLTNKIGTNQLQRYYTIDEVKYRTKPYTSTSFDNYPFFEIYNIYQTELPIDYSQFHSIQIGEQHDFFASSPMPFQMAITIPTEDFLEVISPILIDNYNGMTQAEQVQYILSLTCEKTIALIQQTPNLTLINTHRCPVFDVSGNLTHWVVCNYSITPPEESGYTPEELAVIEASITIHPNPTNGLITIQWDNQYVGVITAVQAGNMAGMIVVNPINVSTTNTTPMDLGLFPPSLYVISFTLDTNQKISRNVIKH